MITGFLGPSRRMTHMLTFLSRHDIYLSVSVFGGKTPILHHVVVYFYQYLHASALLVPNRLISCLAWGGRTPPPTWRPSYKCGSAR